ncbi:MAG: hypothetical protein WBB85_01085 [Albidovulum sp.]|uniref:hypothetical protein n=1 Tax=Albidovulum sp. TaxID=1872424 RepID=UPI003CA69A25
MFLIAGVSTTVADTLRVRAGEHDGFSRIVLDLATPVDWELGRDANGYVLRLARENVEFDLSRIYQMIPRDRIADLVQSGDGTLHFTLGCECHAKAFVTGGGSVVVDIADGPPAPASPFESPILTATPAEESPPPSPHPDVADPKPEIAWRPPSTGFGRAAPDPRLALFWRGVAPPTNARTQSKESQTDVAMDDSFPHVLPPEPEVEPEPLPDHLTAERPAPEGYAPDLPVLSVPIVPDPRVISAQNDLLEQLGRAAAQGLLEVDRDRLRLRGHETGMKTAATSPASASADMGAPAPGILSETSVDRDSKLTVTRAPLTATGGTCIGRDGIDVGTWGDDRPASVQISERRMPLVGEFDKPSDDAVLSLARLYLFLGFGAEARAVLGSFDVQNEAVTPLNEIGLILDGYEVNNGGTLPGMTGCDTPVAMWAVLARHDLPPGTEIDEGAVLRAFSALPPHLRQHLGPSLSAKLLSAGASSSARAIRDAVARIPGDGGAALSMMDGRLSLARGDAEGAEMALAPLAAGNDPLATEALILTIESQLDRHQAVDTAMADAAAALAYERQDGADGPVLTRLHILARGASGDFPAAFDALHRWPGTPPKEVHHDTVTRLFDMLAKTADEGVFLTAYFEERALLTSVTDADLRLSLAQRLADAGFGDEVRALLSDGSGHTEAGRLLLAQVALTDFKPTAALAEVAGLPGQEAMNIRARAFAMDGDHLAAAKTLAALGQAEPAALAAWRGGDWAGAAEATPDAIQRAIRDFRLVPEDSPSIAALSGADVAEPEPTGELAKGRALLAGSQAARMTVTDLLAATGQDGL